MKQTVLVTGATGFLGSNLVKRLLEDGHEIIVFKRSFSNTRRIDNILSQLSTYDLDRCNLEQPFRDFCKIDAVIHTATVYGRKQEKVSDILEANTVFPLRLLQTAIEFKTKTFLNTDTSVDKFLNPYSLSKKQFREWGKYFSLSKKIRFVNIQLEQMLGPGDDASKFPVFVIQQCLNNAPYLEITLGEQKRDFIDIDDVVSAYTLLLEKAFQQEDFFQDYELGSGRAVSIREFVEKVKKLTQAQTDLRFGALPYRENEVMYSQANIQALTQLGWKPNINLEACLLKTIEAAKNAKKLSTQKN